jgi:hypothetical protein
MSATIDGIPWTATAVSVQAAAGVLTLAGTDAAGTTVGVGTVGAVGTNIVMPGGATQASLVTSIGRWQANGLGSGTGSGTITVTTFSATSATGTFSFSVTPAAFTSATGIRTITNGVFSVTF